MTKTEQKELVRQWNSLKNDKDRIKYLHDHKDVLKVVLDNDASWVEFIEEGDYDTDEDGKLKYFSQWFGNDDLVYDLFEFIGITAEGC